MITQAEADEYGRVIEALQAAADVQSMEGRAELAGLLVRARQALRATLTKGLSLQQVAQEADAILSPRASNGAAAQPA